MSKFSDVYAGKKYSVMLGLRFDEDSPQPSGVYSISQEDLEKVVHNNPSYFATVPMHVMCARLDKMGADVCTDVANMIKSVVKGRAPICEFDTVLI